MQQDQQKETAGGNTTSPAPNQQTEHIMVKNPNPRANENISDTPMENNTSETASGVGSEITDGEAG